jgi:hypothetical protein
MNAHKVVVHVMKRNQVHVDSQTFLKIRMKLWIASAAASQRRLDRERFMLLIFERTGQRRYTIHAKRPRLPDVVMNPAARYDPLMPHDLLHLVVEAELGLQGGVFGQVAASGNAGTVHPSPDCGASARASTREKRRMNRRGKTLMRGGRADQSQILLPHEVEFAGIWYSSRREEVVDLNITFVILICSRYSELN